ncbi:MAG: hypothetical protein Q7J30_02000 [Candidatus Azambacteria bacterium]|nr:hypothetical protein [Candidatus Azambacteria bacterium]
MKSAFITLLIISFIGVAVFGFVSMIFGDTHNGGCIVSNRLGAFCPLNSAFNFVVFHIDAFKYFSTAIFSVVLLIILSGMVFSVLPRPLNNDEDDDLIFSLQSGKFPILQKNKEITRWLSLHINSPDFTCQEVKI